SASSPQNVFSASEMSVKGFVRNRGGKRLPNGGYQGGSWTAYWYERSAEGSRRQRSKGGFSSKREAVAYLTTVLESLQSGTYVSPDRTTLGQYLLDLWLPAQKQRLRASTFDDYLRRVTTYIVPHIGGVRLQELDAARLDRFYAHLLTQGGAGGRSLSPKTVRNVHVIVRKSLQDAVRKRLITRNPALDADAPRVPGPGEREMETWTPEELRVFLKAVRDHFLAPAFVLAASTGMRRGEVLGLRWSDVDLEARTVAVRQTVINVAYEVVYSEPKTARGRRTISLDDPTVAVLREHRAKQRERRAAHEGSYEDHDLVFARDDGRPV